MPHGRHRLSYGTDQVSGALHGQPAKGVEGATGCGVGETGNTCQDPHVYYKGAAAIVVVGHPEWEAPEGGRKAALSCWPRPPGEQAVPEARILRSRPLPSSSGALQKAATLGQWEKGLQRQADL